MNVVENISTFQESPKTGIHKEEFLCAMESLHGKIGELQGE